MHQSCVTTISTCGEYRAKHIIFHCLGKSAILEDTLIVIVLIFYLRYNSKSNWDENPHMLEPEVGEGYSS